MQKGLKLIASHFLFLRRMSGAWTRMTAAVILIIFLVSLFVALINVHNGIYHLGLRLISPRAFAAAPVVALGFNEGSGTTTADASGNNNTGTLLGGVTWTTAGKYGKALSFNGSSGVVRIPDSPSWKENGLTGYSVSMWVKVKNVSGDYKVALGKGAWPSDDIVIYKVGDHWEFGIRTTGMACGGQTTALPYLTTVDNTYHHIAVSMNASASRCHFYADGQIVHTDEFVSGTTVFGTGAGLNNLYIGGLDGGQYLNADIDEVRVYKTALTQAEIQTDMNTPIGGAPPGDTTPPVISGVAAGSITTTSATITWTTNENSDSQVEYGLTTAYGQSTTLNPALVTAHSQSLSGLTAGTLYHYRVKSKDAAGNLAVSADFSFTTPQSVTGGIKWLVTDHLGSTRMVVDQTGSLAGIERLDFAPFGEAMTAGVGIRSAILGYRDISVRQKFTSSEHDDETNFDFMQARYYSSLQGRFTSVDPIDVTASRMLDPQQFNLYSYTRNNPLAYTDPTGMDPEEETNPQMEQQRLEAEKKKADALPAPNPAVAKTIVEITLGTSGIKLEGKDNKNLEMVPSLITLLEAEYKNVAQRMEDGTHGSMTPQTLTLTDSVKNTDSTSDSATLGIGLSKDGPKADASGTKTVGNAKETGASAAQTIGYRQNEFERQATRIRTQFKADFVSTGRISQATADRMFNDIRIHARIEAKLTYSPPPKPKK